MAADILTILEQPTLPLGQINAVLDPATGKSLEYKQLSKGPTAAQWSTSFANELGRLANGVGTRMPSGSNTIAFIPKHKMPKHKRPTYGRLVCDIRQHKAETHSWRQPH